MIAVLEKRMIFPEREGGGGEVPARRERRWIIGEKTRRRKKWEAISVVSLFREGTRPG